MLVDKSFLGILNYMLNNVSNDVDKREGSIIYDALAPAAAAMEQVFIDIDLNYSLGMPDTSSGEYLTRLASEFGVNRYQSTKAIRRGKFYTTNDSPFDVPIGSRFSNGGLNYTVLERESLGQFLLECETPGIVGNQEFGSLLSITFINGLTRAELDIVLIPGEDIETDESLRQRLKDEVNSPAFGGNVAAYKKFTGEIDGVGDVKVIPVWNGGGTVKVIILDSSFNPPTQTLVNEVQTELDPVANGGEGLGLAPIGHRVTVVGAGTTTVTIVTTLTLSSGVTPQSIQPQINAVIEDYLLQIRKAWKDSDTTNSNIVRLSNVESRILTVPGVLDVNSTTINGTATNLTITNDKVPTFGGVTINV